MKIKAIVKPTKHNKQILKKRGLFSDDSQIIFRIFTCVMENREIELDTSNPFSDEALQELLKYGLKF